VFVIFIVVIVTEVVVIAVVVVVVVELFWVFCLWLNRYLVFVGLVVLVVGQI